MIDNIQGSYVSQKINKVRWKPEGGLDSQTFLIGSWDDEDNQISLWVCPPVDKDEDIDVAPIKVYSHPHKGDVTEIKFIDNNNFLAASSLGSVQLLRVVDRTQAESTRFITTSSWDNIHYFPTGEESSCTGLASFEEDVATIGEDGRINLLSTREEGITKIYDDADSCSLCSVCFLKHNELLTGNSRGQMKIWDLRSGDDKPQSTFMLSGEQVGATCVTPHPTQRHLLLAGGEDGSVTVWDLRENAAPATLLSAHSQAVSELQFHPDRPEHLFTCSNSGELWHWNTTSFTKYSAINTLSNRSLEENPWLSNDAVKHRIEVSQLMPPLHLPVNSLDLNRSRLVCGSDTEAVYVIKNLPI
ncbi:Nucleoporin Nup43 [Homalodisca vitripennis]|nr:Nucleoporin Nup43 [Homalodisca vitripennis]KAG8263604.1 Nucleoporin Nup43 [Homalodisca vitripennis]